MSCLTYDAAALGMPHVSATFLWFICVTISMYHGARCGVTADRAALNIVQDHQQVLNFVNLASALTHVGELVVGIVLMLWTWYEEDCVVG